MGSLSDEDLKDLLIRYREKADDDAFKKVAEALWQILRDRAWIVVRDHQLAEDATQEALSRMARAVLTGEWKSTEGSVEGWAKIIVHRQAIDQLRKRGKIWLISDLTGIPNRTESALEGRGGEEFQARLQSWLARHATRRERLIIRSYYFKALTLKEIGNRMRPRRSPATVMTLRDKALARLRKFLGDGFPQ